MELKDKILKNREKFDKTNGVYNIFTEELLKFLGEDFFTAPASNMKSMYNAFPGGLIDHILKVTKYVPGEGVLLLLLTSIGIIDIPETLTSTIEVVESGVAIVSDLKAEANTFHPAA